MEESLAMWWSLGRVLARMCISGLRSCLAAVTSNASTVGGGHGVYQQGFSSSHSVTAGACKLVPPTRDELVCLFLNYSPINTVFDWCYAADGSICCIYLGTLLFNGNHVALMVKKMPRCGPPPAYKVVTRFRTSRLARFDRIRDDQFSCLFELRCCCPIGGAASAPSGRSIPPERLLLRGVANLHQPESHFIFVLDAKNLTPLNLLFYTSSVVPDYDPFSDTLLMPQKLTPVPSFSLVSLHPVTFTELARSEFHGVREAEAPTTASDVNGMSDRFFSVQVKVGQQFSIALVSVYVSEQSSMNYELKVVDRATRQIVCQTNFFESGFSFYRFLVQDDTIMFFSLMAHLKRYRITPIDDQFDDPVEAAIQQGGVSITVSTNRVELQETRELRSCVGSRSPSLWPHKDCRHNNYVMELFAWTLQREEFHLRGIVCCSLAAYENGVAADPDMLTRMQATCTDDSGDNVVTACLLG